MTDEEKAILREVQRRLDRHFLSQANTGPRAYDGCWPMQPAPPMPNPWPPSQRTYTRAQLLCMNV